MLKKKIPKFPKIPKIPKIPTKILTAMGSYSDLVQGLPQGSDKLRKPTELVLLFLFFLLFKISIDINLHFKIFASNFQERKTKTTTIRF